MVGGSGADRVFGDSGDDWLYGNTGPDLIRGGAGGDHLFGGDGNDELRIGLDGVTDVARCGLGSDVVYYSTGDVVGPSCERKIKGD